MAQKLIREHRSVIQTIFLGNDDQTVNVVESHRIDFEEIVACIKLGGSVFITSKEGGKNASNLKSA